MEPVAPPEIVQFGLLKKLPSAPEFQLLRTLLALDLLVMN
jgi:hypothetical protein